jgi:hypothetical protein
MEGCTGSECGFKDWKSEYVEEECFLLCFDDVDYDG